MGWSVALACSSVGDPGQAFRPGLTQDPEAAAALARRLYPESSVVETGDTILDFALRLEFAMRERGASGRSV